MKLLPLTIRCTKFQKNIHRSVGVFESCACEIEFTFKSPFLYHQQKNHLCNIFRFQVLNSKMACKDLVNLPKGDQVAFFNSFDTVLTDCDGVLWSGNTPIPGNSRFDFTIFSKKFVKSIFDFMEFWYLPFPNLMTFFVKLTQPKNIDFWLLFRFSGNDPQISWNGQKSNLCHKQFYKKSQGVCQKISWPWLWRDVCKFFLWLHDLKALQSWLFSRNDCNYHKKWELYTDLVVPTIVYIY